MKCAWLWYSRPWFCAIIRAESVLRILCGAENHAGPVDSVMGELPPTITAVMDGRYVFVLSRGQTDGCFGG
jgi:hypothetical protein